MTSLVVGRARLRVLAQWLVLGGGGLDVNEEFVWMHDTVAGSRTRRAADLVVLRATGNNDYESKTGTVTFNPGETQKTITITVNGDKKKEADEEFYVDLTGISSNGLFTKSRGIGTILNDD